MNSSVYGYLTIFHAIVAKGSIAGAARKLEIASPSVSQALKLLEQHIGLPLFNRTTRRIELTDAGKRLFEHTQTAMQSLSIAVESVQDLSETPTGLVRITVPRVAYFLILKPHFAEFCQRFPHIQLEISVFDGTINILKEGFDLGIRFGHSVEENMVVRKLFDSMRLGLYASKDYFERFGKPKKISDLPNHRLVAFRFMTSNRIFPLALQESGQQISVEMPSPLIVNNMEVVMDAVRNGVAIGRIFEPLCKIQPDSDRFHPVLEKHWQSFPPMYLYFLQHSQKAKRIRVLIEFLQEKMKSNLKSG